MPVTVELDPESFPNTLKDVLIEWPLYRTLAFSGEVRDISISGEDLEVSLPIDLQMYCTNCLHDQPWKLVEPVDPSLDSKTRLGILRYKCKACERKIEYFLRVRFTEAGGSVTKIGQYPALLREPLSVLASALSKDDLNLYRNALTCRQSSMGIAAVAYLRRIVENQITYLLDLIADRLRVEDPGSQLLVNLESIKADKRFDVRIDHAAAMLPKSLLVGQNPIKTLHQLTSEGLHGKSDDACVDIFDDCRLAFEHVIKRLRQDKEEDEGYVDALKKLGDRKTKTTSAPSP